MALISKEINVSTLYAMREIGCMFVHIFCGGRQRERERERDVSAIVIVDPLDQ